MKSISYLTLAVMFALVISAPVLADDEPGYLGVQIKNAADGDGVVIVMILKDSPAHDAELQADDIIKKYDGKEVANVRGFVQSVKESKPGSKVKLTLIRNGQEKEVEVKIGKKSEDK